MTAAADLRPARSPDTAARVERVEGCPASFYRYLYAEVGRAYRWVDRVAWTDERHPRPPLRSLRLALAPHRARRAGRVLRAQGGGGRVGRDRVFRAAARVHRPGLRKAPPDGGRGARLVGGRAPGVAAHLLAGRSRPPCRTIERAGFRPFREETYSVTAAELELASKFKFLPDLHLQGRSPCTTMDCCVRGSAPLPVVLSS